MLDDDLKNLVGDVKRVLDERHATFTRAREIEEDDRQEFLRRYRKCAENEILPVLREVAKEHSDSFRVKLNDYSSIASVSLEVDVRSVRCGNGRLSYQGDYKRKKVLVVIDKWSDMGGEYEPEELTRTTVNEHVRQLVSHLTKNLG